MRDIKMEMNKEQRQRAHEGLLSIIGDELFRFDGKQTLEQASSRRQKLANLIFYARQVNHKLGTDAVDKAQEQYENKLSELKRYLE